MKIVIDISEKQYRWITDCEIIPEMLKEELIDAIRAGKPLQTGTWKAHEDSKIPGYWHYGCSLCGCEVEKARNYCPNCGAKLEGFENG